MTDPHEKKRNHLSSSPFKQAAEPTVEVFEVDDRISHDLHGLGRVVNKEAHAVTVDFGSQRLRVVSPYTKLHHL